MASKRQPKTRRGLKKRQIKRQKAEAQLAVEKATVASMYDSGESVSAIARTVGIDRKQVYRWIREGETLEVPANLLEAGKRGISALLVSKFLEISSYLTPKKIAKLNPTQLVVAMGIIADKIQKMGGEDLPNVVNINVGDAKPVDEQLRDQILAFQAEIARRHSNGPKESIGSGIIAADPDAAGSAGSSEEGV